MALGRVHLVGAGPGDPELLTLKAARLIARADVLVYDRLVHPAILDHARPMARLVFAGKAGGETTARMAVAPSPRPAERGAARERSQQRIPLPDRRSPRESSKNSAQAWINQRLIAEARAGQDVVRLKGGDPFVFGRGGEEALALARAGIPFDVVPGVTSGVAAAAYAGIPVTHRGLAADATFATARLSAGEQEWARLAGAGTLVLFMCGQGLAPSAAALIGAGKPAGTPCALIEAGTWPAGRKSLGPERVVVGTLADIASRVPRPRSPALLVIGPVVALRQRLGAFLGAPAAEPPRSRFQVA